MKSLLGSIENILSLQESLFDVDGIERLGAEIEKDSVKAFLNKCKGNFSTVMFKDGSVRVNGKLIITGLTEKQIFFNCRDFHGQLIIENCPGLETLKNSFLEKIFVFDGSITINQCPNLESIEGIPGMVKGSVSITNCKKLKDFGSLESVFGGLYWQHNGKKFTPEQIGEKVHVFKKIYCSVEDEEVTVTEGIINEAFNNPWLQRLAKQFKKYPYKQWSYDKDSPDKYNTVDDLFKYHGMSSSIEGRLLDKITSEDVDVYDMSNENDRKDLAKAFYYTYSSKDANAGDIILVYKEDIEEFVEGYGITFKPRGESNEGIERLNIPNKENTYNGNKIFDRYISKTDAKERLLKYRDGYIVVVFNSGRDSGSHRKDRHDIKQARAEAQKGIINPGDVDQYKQIAAANIKRYKEIIAKNKALKKSDNNEYEKLLDAYEAINTRVFKLVRDVAKNPKNYEKYKVEGFITWIRDEQRYNRDYKPWKKNSGSQYYGDNGLVLYFNKFIQAYMSCFGNSYKTTPDEYDYKTLENAAKNFRVALELADKKLKGFGF